MANVITGVFCLRKQQRVRRSAGQITQSHSKLDFGFYYLIKQV